MWSFSRLGDHPLLPWAQPNVWEGHGSVAGHKGPWANLPMASFGALAQTAGRALLMAEFGDLGHIPLTWGSTFDVGFVPEGNGP